MDHHKIMFKETSLALSGRKQLNLEHQRAARSKKREDIFQSNRIISVSPTPIKQETVGTKQMPSQPQQTNAAPTTSKALVPGKENQQPAQREQFMQRYLKWKSQKSQSQTTQKRQAVHCPAPAFSSVAFANKSSTFRPPEGLKQPQLKSEQFQAPSKRRSLYLLVDSKASIKNQHKLAAAQPMAKCPTTFLPVANGKKLNHAMPKLLPTTVKPLAPIKKPLPNKETTNTITKPLPNKVAANAITKPLPTSTPLAKTQNKNQNALPTAARPKPAATKPLPPATHRLPSSIKPVMVRAPPAPAAAAKLKRPATTAIATTSKLAVASKPPPANLRSEPFVRPAVSQANIAKPIRGGGGGAAGKFKHNQDVKRTTVAAAGRSKANAAHLSTRMKPKKPDAGAKQRMLNAAPNLKANVLSAIAPLTPLETQPNDNPFQAQTTSTHIKSNNSSSGMFEAYPDIECISPVAVSKRMLSSSGSTAKRKLMPTQEAAKKFNFVRYSVAKSPVMSPTSIAEEPTMEPQVTAVAVEEATLQPQTPPRTSTEPCEPLYLSPFVSVSRGKVNSRSEREKRNSMYLQDLEQLETEMPVELRRTLETVIYFRLQLSNEIERLNSLCAQWEAYCVEHEALLLETGGMDMINAAIGQTKLLSTKKLMQFGSLIDRCEAGATGVGAKVDDGSEKTKPVQAVDLEGWWDMVRLQSDNVDKRFHNLERWKANEWQDPDELPPVEAPKPKPKAKLAKALKTKPTVKPNSNLKQFLRKALAEQRKKQAVEAQAEEEPTVDQDQLPTTPSKRRSQRLSGVHRVIVVRDRKSFSPARTVLRVSNGGTPIGAVSGRLSIGGARPSIGGARPSIGGARLSIGGARPSIGGARPSIGGGGNEMLRSAILGAVEQRRFTMAATPPRQQQPLSILKTPGTAKTGARSVLFSAKKKVREFNFTTYEGNDSGSEACGADKLKDFEEDMSLESSNSRQSSEQLESQGQDNGPVTPGNTPRTYTLRNRRVKLRPSAEFMSQFK